MKNYLKLGAILVLTVIICTCSACVPFLDGAVEAQDYFEETVKCSIFTVNPDADGGFDTVESSLALAALTDDNEKNIALRRYYSFTFKANNEDFTLQAVAFIVEAQEAATFGLRLENDAAVFNRSIELEAGTIGTVEFTELNLSVVASSELIITLINPLLSDVPYRIDSVIFLV